MHFDKISINLHFSQKTLLWRTRGLLPHNISNLITLSAKIMRRSKYYAGTILYQSLSKNESLEPVYANLCTFYIGKLLKVPLNQPQINYYYFIGPQRSGQELVIWNV
jgi:hypothetical protein